MHKIDTKAKLLSSAKKEFETFGYQKASLRRICKNADVTTGALYFFFDDKADVFDALVGDIANKIMTMLSMHTTMEEPINDCHDQEDITNDILFGRTLISYYFQNKESANLLFNCAAGSPYEDFTDRIISFLEERNRTNIYSIFQQTNQVFNECTIHWLAHIQAESILHILTHDFTEERALQQVEIVINYLISGFDRLSKMASEEE